MTGCTLTTQPFARSGAFARLHKRIEHLLTIYPLIGVSSRCGTEYDDNATCKHLAGRAESRHMLIQIVAHVYALRNIPVE